MTPLNIRSVHAPDGLQAAAMAGDESILTNGNVHKDSVSDGVVDLGPDRIQMGSRRWARQRHGRASGV